MKSKMVLFVLALIGVSNAWAQCSEYKWPTDIAKAEKQVESFRSAMKEQNYKGATAASIGC